MTQVASGSMEDWGSLFFFKVICQISRSHGLKNRSFGSDLSKFTRPVTGIKLLRFALFVLCSCLWQETACFFNPIFSLPSIFQFQIKHSHFRHSMPGFNFTHRQVELGKFFHLLNHIQSVSKDAKFWNRANANFWICGAPNDKKPYYVKKKN